MCIHACMRVHTHTHTHTQRQHAHQKPIYSFCWHVQKCDDFLPISGASSVPLCYVLFPATLPHQLFFHPLSPHLAIYFLVYLSILFPNSYMISFWEFYFLPFSVHAQTNAIYLTLLSQLYYEVYYLL